MDQMTVWTTKQVKSKLYYLTSVRSTMCCVSGEETAEKIQNSDAVDRMIDEANHVGRKAEFFQQTFTKEVKDGFRKMIEDMKQQKKWQRIGINRHIIYSASTYVLYPVKWKRFVWSSHFLYNNQIHHPWPQIKRYKWNNVILSLVLHGNVTMDKDHFQLWKKPFVYDFMNHGTVTVIAEMQSPDRCRTWWCMTRNLD